MREIRTSGSEGGGIGNSTDPPYPYFTSPPLRGVFYYSSRLRPPRSPSPIRGTGRDARLRLNPEPEEEGFRVALEDGAVAGRCELFDQPLVEAMNAAVHLIRQPRSLACLLEAAGGAALERCGAILAALRPRE